MSKKESKNKQDINLKTNELDHKKPKKKAGLLGLLAGIFGGRIITPEVAFAVGGVGGVGPGVAFSPDDISPGIDPGDSGDTGVSVGDPSGGASY
jgi:hypothetical protein